MSFTRKSLAETIEAYDADIEKLQQSKRETFSDYRDQLGLEGRDKDAVKAEIAAFKSAMKRSRAVAKKGEEAVEEQDDLVDEIFIEITAARAPRAARVENIEQFGSDKAKPESNLQKVQTAPTEPQPDPQAGSDLAASPANDDGQVADISDIGMPISNEAEAECAPVAPSSNELGDGNGLRLKGEATLAAPSVGIRHDGALAADSPITQREDDASPAPPLSLYAPKGETIWELAPPDGVIRHEYSQAFGEAGQDIAVIEDDMANAASAPIIKIGNVILDGWARYLKARELGIEYPVEQYAGTDSLMDCIKWNTGGRMMTSEQSFRIAQRLAKAEPKRKAEIYAAFELGMALA